MQRFFQCILEILENIVDIWKTSLEDVSLMGMEIYFNSFDIQRTRNTWNYNPLKLVIMSLLY